jgi:hypothetical protein
MRRLLRVNGHRDRPAETHVRLRAVSLSLLTAVLAAPLLAQTAPGERKLYPVPVLGYAPETSLMLGVALAGLVNFPESTNRRPTSFLVAAVYTLKSQYSVSLGADRWSARNRWQTSGEVAFSRFPQEFHGIGAGATDSSETYTPQTLLLSLAARRRVGSGGALYAGVTYAFQHQQMLEVVPGGRLAAGTVPGSTGGRAAMLGLEVLHDTRLVVYGPRSGHLLRMSAGVGDAAVGSEFDFRRYTADVRYYRRLRGATVVAWQVVVDAVDGTVPFERLPKLGGQSILRGYTEPRYRDDAMVAAQLELRMPVRGRFGAVAFGGLGAVAPTLGELADRTFHPAGGLGVRFLLDPRSGFQLRMDLAAAPGGGGFYIAAGDAF